MIFSWFNSGVVCFGGSFFVLTTLSFLASLFVCFFYVSGRQFELVLLGKSIGRCFHLHFFPTGQRPS